MGFQGRLGFPEKRTSGHLPFLLHLRGHDGWCYGSHHETMKCKQKTKDHNVWGGGVEREKKVWILDDTPATEWMQPMTSSATSNKCPYERPFQVFAHPGKHNSLSISEYSACYTLNSTCIFPQIISKFCFHTEFKQKIKGTRGSGSGTFLHR